MTAIRGRLPRPLTTTSATDAGAPMRRRPLERWIAIVANALNVSFDARTDDEREKMATRSIVLSWYGRVQLSGIVCSASQPQQARRTVLGTRFSPLW